MESLEEVKEAEEALSRGEYKKCLNIIDDLMAKKAISSQDNKKIKMLKITAWMGQGEDQKAISACRVLMKDRDPILRQQGKNLISVLEAPSLPRPSNWSVQMSNLDGVLSGNSYQVKSKKESINKKNIVLYPPTGATKGLDYRFSGLVVVIMLLLTFLLSGCVQVTSTMKIQGPDQIKMDWNIHNESKSLLPWQEEFEQSLRRLIPKVHITSESNGNQLIDFPSGNARNLSTIFENISIAASQSGGIYFQPPEIELKEKNWLIGVKQNLNIALNLKDIPNIPGLEMTFIVKPVQKKQVIISEPLTTTHEGSEVVWEIKKGSTNKLSLVHWEWSQLGLGLLIVIGITILSRILQSIRLKMGFGFDELPP